MGVCKIFIGDKPWESEKHKERLTLSSWHGPTLWLGEPMSTDQPKGRSKTKYMGTSQNKSCKTCTNLNKCHNTSLYGQNQQLSPLKMFADTQTTATALGLWPCALHGGRAQLLLPPSATPLPLCSQGMLIILPPLIPHGKRLQHSSLPGFHPAGQCLHPIWRWDGSITPAPW